MRSHTTSVTSAQILPTFQARFGSAALLVTQFALLSATFFTLSSAIGWPASLDDPADIALPRLVANAGAVAFGYSSYLLAAILIVPATAALVARLRLPAAMAGLVIALAILSAFAKAIGITRWLFAMPVLADAYGAPQADQGQIALIFDMLNAWAGGIGEVLGVGLFGGLWTIAIGLGVRATGERLSAAAAWFAVLGGAGLLLVIPGSFGIDLGPATLTMTNILWQFSLLAVGIWSLQSPKVA